jgi:RHH-type proline utilization regulon transcriptional repressor/proline dehydrogenase/delta 1-pyrroline-5-carboxylate dehydrogenase
VTASWPSLCRASARLRTRPGRRDRDQHRRGGGRPARPVARRDRGRAARPGLAGWDGFGVVVQAYSAARRRGDRLARTLAGGARPPLHGAAGEGRLLGHRDQARAGRGAGGFPGLHPQGGDGCLLPRLRAKAAGRPTGSTRNSPPTTPTPWPRSCRWPATGPTASSSSACTAWASAARDGAPRPRHACRIYAPVGRASRPAGLSRAAAAGKRREQLLRQPGARRGRPARRWPAIRSPRWKALGPHPRVSDRPDCSARARELQGFDLHDRTGVAESTSPRDAFAATEWSAAPILAVAQGGGTEEPVTTPPTGRQGRDGHPDRAADVERAIAAAPPVGRPRRDARRSCAAPPISTRHFAPEIFALLAREAGKTPADAMAELREAVDFLRYYAARATALADPPRGVFACISPWNFPLAIFTGQIAAALAAGNAVLAKPAEATPAHRRAGHGALHEAGVPARGAAASARHGSVVGAALTSHPGVDGVAFTGSTATAQAIHRAMAANLAPDATLIAETGGLNAMIVDSTALPEQAVRDIIASAFQSAGQRCSALRCLYVQEDVAGQCPEDALRRDGRTRPRRSMGPPHRYRPGHRRRRPGLDRRLYRRGGGRGAAPAPGRRAGGRAFRRPLAPSGCAASPIWSARSSARSCTSRPSGPRRSTL